MGNYNKYNAPRAQNDVSFYHILGIYDLFRSSSSKHELLDQLKLHSSHKF